MGEEPAESSVAFVYIDLAVCEKRSEDEYKREKDFIEKVLSRFNGRDASHLA